MPGKTPQRNGNEPVENGIRNNNNDVEMTDEKSSLKGKGKKGGKEGEDMTVVVPPSKNSKQTPADAEGDVAMDEDAEQELEVKVDPVTQAITGASPQIARRLLTHLSPRPPSGDADLPVCVCIH